MPKSFKLNNDIYDIPDDKVSLFMSQFPDATGVQSFVAGQDTFDVPIQDVQRFVEAVPGAKPLSFSKTETSIDDTVVFQSPRENEEPEDIVVDRNQVKVFSGKEHYLASGKDGDFYIPKEEVPVNAIRVEIGVPDSIADYDGNVDDLLEVAVKEEVKKEELSFRDKANLATGGFLGRKFPGMFKAIDEKPSPEPTLTTRQQLALQMGRPVAGDVADRGIVEPENKEPIFDRRTVDVKDFDAAKKAMTPIYQEEFASNFTNRFQKNFTREITLGYKDEPLEKASGTSDVIADVMGSFAGITVPLIIPIGGTQLAIGKLATKIPRLLKFLQLGLKGEKAAKTAKAIMSSGISNIFGFNIHGQAYKHPEGTEAADRIKELIPTTMTALAFTGAGALGHLGKLGRIASYPTVGAIGWEMTPDDPNDPLNTTNKMANALALMALHRTTGSQKREMREFVDKAYPEMSGKEKNNLVSTALKSAQDLALEGKSPKKKDVSGLRRDDFVTEMRAEPPKQPVDVKITEKVEYQKPTTIKGKKKVVGVKPTKPLADAAVKERGRLQKEQNDLFKEYKQLDPKSPEALSVENRIDTIGKAIDHIDALNPNLIKKPTTDLPKGKDSPTMTLAEVKATHQKLLTEGKQTATGLEVGMPIRVKGIDKYSGQTSNISQIHKNGDISFKINKKEVRLPFEAIETSEVLLSDLGSKTPVKVKTVEKPTVAPKPVETPVKPKVEPTSVKPESTFKVGQTVMYQTGRMTKPRTGKISEIVSKDGKQTSFIIDKRPVQISEVSLTNRQISARNKADILKPFSKPERKRIKSEAKEFDELILKNADLITERADQLHSQLFEGRESQKGIDIATGEFKRSLSEEFGKTAGIEDVGFSPLAKSKALVELKKLVDADKKKQTGIVEDVKALDEQTSVEFFDRLAKDDVVKKPVGTATLKVNKVDPVAVREVTNLKETLNNLTEQKNSPEFKNLTKIQQEKIQNARRKAAELLLEHKKLKTPGTEILGADVIPGAGAVMRAISRWRASRLNKSDANLRGRLEQTQNVLYKKWVEGGKSDKFVEKQMQEISDAINQLDASVKEKMSTADIEVISKDVKESKEAQSVIDALTGEVKKSLKLQRKLSKAKITEISKEKGKRKGSFVELRDSLIKKGVPHGEATKIATSKFKGELSDKKTIPPELLPKISDAEWEVLQREAYKQLPESDVAFTQVNASKAIDKIKDGEVLQNSEIKLMAELFGEDLGKALRKQKPLSDRFFRELWDIISFPKTVLAGGDVSATARQLLPTLFNRPNVWAKSVKAQVEAYKSEAKYKEHMADIKADPYYEEAASHGMPFTEYGKFSESKVLEESFPSRIAGKVPLVNRGNRAMVVATNKAKMGLYGKIRAQWDKSGKPPTESELNALVRQVSDLTGRAVLPGEQLGSKTGKVLRQIAMGLNVPLFAPRFAVSVGKNVFTAFHTVSKHPRIMKEGIRTLTGGAIAITAAATLAKTMTGEDVEINPLSADFMKGKDGNTRYDLLGGHGQVIRFIARIATGKTKTAAGQIKDTEWERVVEQFVKSKRAPIMNMISALYTGEDFIGDPIEGIEGWSDEALNNFLFLFIQDGIESFQDAYEDEGYANALLDALAATSASAVGIGVQTYPERSSTSRTIFRDEIAQKEHSKPWADLSPDQLKDIKKEYKDGLQEVDQAVKAERLSRSDFDYVGENIAREKEAGENVLNQLSTKSKNEIGNISYSIGISRRSGDWAMNDKLYEKHQKQTAEILDGLILKRIGKESWANKSFSQKESILLYYIDRAKSKSLISIKKEVNKN